MYVLCIQINSYETMLLHRLFDFSLSLSVVTLHSTNLILTLNTVACPTPPEQIMQDNVLQFSRCCHTALKTHKSCLTCKNVFKIITKTQQNTHSMSQPQSSRSKTEARVAKNCTGDTSERRHVPRTADVSLWMVSSMWTWKYSWIRNFGRIDSSRMRRMCYSMTYNIVVGGVSQWLERRSLTGELSLIYT